MQFVDSNLKKFAEKLKWLSNNGNYFNFKGLFDQKFSCMVTQTLLEGEAQYLKDWFKPPGGESCGCSIDFVGW